MSPTPLTPSFTASSLDMDALLGSDARRSPDMQAVWDWLVEQDAGLPNWLTLPAAQGRAQYARTNARWNVAAPEMAATTRLEIPGHPDLPAVLLEPRGAQSGALLYLHGGGWTFGDLATHDRLMRLLAEDTGLRVLGVDYRRAPEHPAPAAFEDSLAAWQALADKAAEPGFDGPLVVAGDSAGANLALALTLHEIAAGRRRPDAALLFYGAYKAGMDTPSAERFAEGYGLSRAGMAQFWDWYVPPDGSVSRTDARVSPLLAPEADMARLPPVFLNAAGLDPLLSDTVDLATRLEAASVPHRLVIHEGVHHGFMQMSLRLPEGRLAIRQAAGFLAEQNGR